MTNRFGGMPLPSKMYAFQREISGHERFMPWRQAQYGTIVADPPTEARAFSRASAAADIRDQGSFWQRQGKTNI